MKLHTFYIKSILLTVALLFIAGTAQADVPVRISIKWIVDASGNRPVSGNLDTNDEINTEVDEGNRILGLNFSEFRLDLLELYDLTGVSHYYSTHATVNNCENVGNLRTDARNDTSTYGWRDDAINIYVNAGTGSACSRFPSENDIILMNQW